MGWVARWLGLVGVAGRRVWTQATTIAPGRVLFTVSGIALPVALVVLVSSVSLGLAAAGTVESADVDYWIVPESGASSPVVSVGGPQLGRVHPVSDRLRARDEVFHSTPVLIDLVRPDATGSSGYIVAVGVIPPEGSLELMGVSTAGLTPGDPHYANGSFDGPWTGEIVLSAGGARVLGVQTGDSLTLSGQGPAERRFAVANVSSTGAVGTDFPVAIVHLSELQTLVGATGSDRADQILVQTTESDVRPGLESVYPRSMVLEKSGLSTQQVIDSRLPLAVGVTAFVVAAFVGILFTATTLGLAVTAASRERALLGAIGFSGRSRAVMLAIETVVIALAGGVIGVGVGWMGIPIANRLGSRWGGDAVVALAHPLLIPYGLGVALGIAILVLPYLLFMSRRATTVEALSE